MTAAALAGIGIVALAVACYVTTRFVRHLAATFEGTDR